MAGEDDTDSTLTQNIKVLRERLEETNDKLKVLEESRFRRRQRLALERQYPSRWKKRP